MYLQFTCEYLLLLKELWFKKIDIGLQRGLQGLGSLSVQDLICKVL